MFCFVFSFEFQWATQTQAENEQILFQGLELTYSQCFSQLRIRLKHWRELRPVVIAVEM